jgi:hypothetical protein
MNMKNVKSKSAVSMILVAVVIVIIVVAAAAGAYYLTQQNPSASPTPSPSATATPTVSPTATPAASAAPTSSPTTSPIANFKAGAYAIYNTTTYTEGVATVSGLNFTIGEDTFNGTPCWTLITTAGNDTSNVVITERVSKSNTSEILGNVTMKLYQNGVLTYETEFNPATDSTTGIGTEEINPQTIIGQETITVPAGTFNCMKASVTSTTTTTNDSVTTLWINQNVPAFGMVKGEEKVNGTLSSTLELLSYGGWP